MQRIHLSSSNINNEVATITTDVFHHLFTVCRLKTGAKIEIVVNESRLLICKITSIENNQFSFNILDQLSNEPTREIPIHLIQSLPKQDKLTDVCKLFTELGGNSIFPVISEFCDSTTISNQKLKRIQTSIDSAAKQSKQLVVPKFYSPLSLSDQLDMISFPKDSLRLVAFEGCSTDLNSIISHYSFSSIFIAIGPEGGYSQSDISLFESHGFRAFSLGKSILRTEHAAFAAVYYLDGFLSKAP